MVDAKQLARAGYTYLGRLYSEMDCQELIERCLADCGLKIDLAGSNTWYRRMTWTGTPEECRATFGHIPVGAFLFMVYDTGKEPVKYRKDGIGDASHIGIYTGTGRGSIHSSYTKGCVIESTFKGKSIKDFWNRVGLWDQISYDVDITGGGSTMETYQARVVGGKLIVRASPEGERIDRFPEGAIVTVSKEDGDWVFASFNSTQGWVMAKYLERFDSNGAVQTGDETVTVPKNLLEKIYDQLGDWLGLRG